MTGVALSLTEVEELARRCLLANGCDQANADAVAATVCPSSDNLRQLAV